jgi:sugar/nucleoside kinase (ribokinase family)
MPKASFIKTMIIGNITNDFIINVDGKASNQIPGGSLLYAAAGAKMWSDEIGLVGRYSEGFPLYFLERLEMLGFDIRGVVKDSRIFESRRFFAWRDAEHLEVDNPVAHYARYGLTFPHDLLGFHIENLPSDEYIWRHIYSNFQTNLPKEFLNITAALICPMDFSTQVKMVNLLESNSINTMVISPSSAYMKPDYIDKLHVLIKGATAFITNETDLTNLCHLRARDIWEMMEIISAMGCQSVLVSCGMNGYLLYDAGTGKRFKLPIYPVRWVDPTGSGEVFAGAFLGEYKNSYDLVRSLLYASVSVSIAVEGSGPFYCLEALHGLAEARFQKMQQLLCFV